MEIDYLFINFSYDVLEENWCLAYIQVNRSNWMVTLEFYFLVGLCASTQKPTHKWSRVIFYFLCDSNKKYDKQIQMVKLFFFSFASELWKSK